VHAGSWWPACSLAAVILAAALTYFCRTWIVVCIAAVVGVAGVLVYFYIALAIAARAAAGSVSQSVNAAMTSQPPLATAALLTTLGLALLGVEAVTTLSDRVSSVSRPMGLAIAVTALCATTGWVAVTRASSAVGLAFDESWIVL